MSDKDICNKTVNYLQFHTNSSCLLFPLFSLTCTIRELECICKELVICRRTRGGVQLVFSSLIVMNYFFQISTWPLSVPGSNGTYLQQPVAFLPDASALAQTPSRRLDKSDKLEVRDDLKNVDLNEQFKKNQASYINLDH